MHLGIMKSNDLQSFDNAKKFGLLLGHKVMNYSFDVILINNKDFIHGLTICLPF